MASSQVSTAVPMYACRSMECTACVLTVVTRSRGGAIVSGVSCAIFRDGPGRYRALFGAVEVNGGV
eukprot:3613347-Prymnesium_polylepis.1